MVKFLYGEVVMLSLFCLFQEECLLRLQNRIEVQYDGSNREHQVLCFYIILLTNYFLHGQQFSTTLIFHIVLL
jgi:hypothetical protein